MHVKMRPVGEKALRIFHKGNASRAFRAQSGLISGLTDVVCEYPELMARRLDGLTHLVT